MSYTLLVVTLVAAIIDWIAVARKIHNLEYIFKPATMLLLIAWLWQNTSFEAHTLWFAIGFAFSLAGDVFLMLPREQFIAGLVAFLLGHLAFLVGLNQVAPPLNIPSLVLAIIIAFTAMQIYRRIAAGLQAKGLTRLKVPVLIYTIVISLMLLSAFVTLVRDEWQPGPALLVSGGALLFFLSDTILAWNKFVSPLRHGRLTNIIPYHLGQILLALGAAYHLLY